jgi:peroxiredoxin
MQSISAQESSAGYYEINAVLPYWDSTFLSIVVDGETIHADSVRRGALHFSGKVSSAKEALFLLTDGHVKVTQLFYLEPGTITIKDHARRTVWFDFTGTVNNDLLFSFNHAIDSIYPRKYLFATGDTARMHRKLQCQYVQNYIQQHRGLLINLALFRFFILAAQLSIEDKLEIFNLIEDSIRNTFGGQEIFAKLNQLLNTSIGKKAPNFSLSNSNNRKITLESFRGKYLLIDFWASWCEPCRQQTPLLRKAYDQFKDKGFTIISISLDTDKRKWIDAIEKDEMKWTNLSDLKGWQNGVAKQYYIDEIPANLLLNTEGVIIEKNLDGNDLILKLSLLLGKDSGKNH